MKCFSPVVTLLAIGFFFLVSDACAQAATARELIIKADYSAAAAALQDTVGRGEPDALMLQGVLHALGAGVPYDHSLALEYWQKAALEGHRDAARLLLPWLHSQQAREWWTANISSMAPAWMEAPKTLVREERGGLIVIREKANKWIARESESGNPVALFNAYHAAQFGARNSEAGQARVRKLLERAAEMKLPSAMMELSSQLEQSWPVPRVVSLGFEKDVAKAAELMKGAADIGDKRAQLLWGHWQNSKRALVRDPVAAVEYYRRSSDQGSAYAAYFLFEAYARGEGVSKDAAKASEYLRLSAERGMDTAVKIYAQRLFKGQNMEPDQSAAIRMLERSLVCSAVPDADSIALVAHAYASGSGVARNREHALWWARWAAEKGSDSASELAKKLTETQDRR
jgi:uncharacterized protein